MALFNYQAVDIAELRKNNKLRTSNDKANFRYESQIGLKLAASSRLASKVAAGFLPCLLRPNS